MQAAIHILHESDFYRIKDFRCQCLECSVSVVEYCDYFYICFIRSGFYEHRSFRQTSEAHIGRIHIAKPGMEYTIRHIHNQPDNCTSINFTTAFYESLKKNYGNDLDWFFHNKDLYSLLLNASPQLDYLHHQVIEQVKLGNHLEIDELVLQLVEKIMQQIANKPALAPIPERLVKYHLLTVEKAREYLFAKFDKDISMQQLADHCHVSLFHFSRIFKQVMLVTPHQYLTEIRLNHARILIQNCQQKVTEIAYQCGFNNAEHFTTAYRQRFGMAPTAYRRKLIS